MAKVTANEITLKMQFWFDLGIRRWHFRN